MYLTIASVTMILYNSVSVGTQQDNNKITTQKEIILLNP